MAWHPFRHLGLKALALALGTLLWLTVSGHQITRSIRIDLSFSNLPADFQMVSDPDPVRIMVRGDDSIVGALTAGSVRLVVDLSHGHEGDNLYPLTTEQVLAPPNIEVVMVDPGAVTVRLEKSATRDVAVRPTVDGTPAPGFVVGEIEVDPKTITVVGPQSRVARGVSVVTERISIEGLSKTTTETVGVVVVDSQVRPAESRRVRVVVPIVPGRGR